MIPFTQFMLPDGRPIPGSIDRPPEIEGKALALIEEGCRFEIEVLTTGQINMDCSNDNGKWEDHPDTCPICSRICPNGPEVLGVVDELVIEAYDLWQGIKGEENEAT